MTGRTEGGSWDLVCVAAWLVITLSGPRRKGNRHKEVAKASFSARCGSWVISLFVRIILPEHFAAYLQRLSHLLKPGCITHSHAHFLLASGPSSLYQLCSLLPHRPADSLLPPACHTDGPVPIGMSTMTPCPSPRALIAPPLYYKDNVKNKAALQGA